MSKRFTKGQQEKCAKRVQAESGRLERQIHSGAWELRERKEQEEDPTVLEYAEDLYRFVQKLWEDGEPISSSLLMANSYRNLRREEGVDLKIALGAVRKMFEKYGTQLKSLGYENQGSFYILSEKGKQESKEFGCAR